MINIQIQNKLLSFHFTFFASFALILLFKDVDIVIIGFCTCLLHEIGHILAMMFCRNPAEKIVFYGMGIKISGTNRDFLPFENDFIILSAGIFTNIIAAIVSFLSKTDHSIMFAQVNLLIAAFNLLPFEIFDGGRIRELLIYNYFEFITADKILKALKKIDFIVFGFAFFTLIFTGIKNPWIYIGILFYLLVGMIDLKATEN
jgi:Zn-dependent protease